MKCIACGSNSLVEGELVDMKGSTMSNFKLMEVSRWKCTFGIGIRNVRALGCVSCQHLQFVIDFNEEDLRRYQHFEGKQPGFLERISEETEPR